MNSDTVNPIPPRVFNKRRNEISVTPAIGEVTYLSGRILGPSGNPVRNALVEIWQVDAKGSYLHTRGANGQNGDITVNAALIYSSSHDFSLLANGNILVNAAIKNTRAVGSGAINLISGWDGSTGLTGGSSTAFNAGNPGGTPIAQAIDIGALLGTPGSFGGTGGIGGGGAITLGANLVSGSGPIRLLGPTLLTTAVTVDTT